MLDERTFQELLTGGLDDTWLSATRRWLDEYKDEHHVDTDVEAIATYSDTVLVPWLVDAGVLFQNKAVWRCDLIGLPTPRFSIQLIPKEDSRLVVIHEGFIHLLTFLTEASLLCFLVSERMPWLDESARDQLDIHVRYRTIRLAKRYLVEPFRLPSIRDQFPPDIRSKLHDELTSMLAFAVLHEIAHQDLGHGKAAVATAPSGAGPHVVFEERHGFFKQQEYDADLQAIRSVHQNHTSFFAGVVLFLEHLNLLETYALHEKLTHPMAVNRLSFLAHHLPDEFGPEVRELARTTALKGADWHRAQRGIDQHWKFEVQALAGPERPLDEYLATAKVICDGARIWERFLSPSAAGRDGIAQLMTLMKAPETRVESPRWTRVEGLRWTRRGAWLILVSAVLVATASLRDFAATTSSAARSVTTLSERDVRVAPYVFLITFGICVAMAGRALLWLWRERGKSAARELGVEEAQKKPPS